MTALAQTVLLATGARTTTQTLGAYANPDETGIVEAIEVVVDLTAFTTAASLTLSFQEFVPDGAGSGTWSTIISAAALTATGQARLRIGPEFTSAANVAVSAFVAPSYRVVVTHGNANSHTYSVVAKIAYGRG